MAPLSRGFFFYVPLQLCLNMTQNLINYIKRTEAKKARTIKEQVKSVTDMRTQHVII